MSKKRQQERKKKARQDRMRQQKHVRHFQSPVFREDGDAVAPEEGIPERPPFRAMHERLMRDLQAAIIERGIQTEEELQAFMAEYNQNMRAGMAFTERSQDPIERAQDRAFEAMDAESPAEARRLAQEALALDPDCIDAMIVLAPLEARSSADLAARLEKVVQAGERKLGPDFFEDNKGHFWGIVGTRPYMRARAELAGLLARLDRTADAVAHYEGLLELNPNDNQGNRDGLLNLYLEIDDVAGARRLFDQYSGDSSAVFAWGRLLERLLSGAMEEAVLARREAMAQNPFVEDYLISSKRMPQRLPSAYAPGEESEAVVCAWTLRRAWARHPRALSWLTNMAMGTVRGRV